ncbi:MAG: NAD(+) synthase [Bacteroidota bacterium]
MRKIKLAGASLNQTPISWSHNRKNISSAIHMAKQDKVDILCLPELCITGYGCEDLFLSEWLPQRALDELLNIVSETKGIAVSLGLPYRLDGRLFNCACFIKDGEILGFNVKQNLANEGVHYEPRWFTPGRTGEVYEIEIASQKYRLGDLTYEIDGVKIGFEICEDAWSGDKRPACRLLEKNIDLIINGSASHFAIGKSKSRQELFRKSSEDFNCTYLYVNPLGNESGRIIFDGEIIVAQKGQMLMTNELCSMREIDYKSIDIDFDEASDHKTDIAPQESAFVEFTQATTLGLFDYLRKSKSQGYVLSLSGGADSSTCAVLVAEMVQRGVSELGIEAFLNRININNLKDSSAELDEKEIVKEVLKCAYQSTENSSKDTFNSAKYLADSIGAKFYNWKVDEQIKAYSSQIESALDRQLTWETDDIALQNIQARARAPIIWMMANIHNALLITTSNRSEGDVGYATMDGDTSGSLAPIAAIDKFFILNWLKWAEQELGYEGLNLVNQLNPSAELRPLEKTQKDEDDLMPYSVILEIEKLAIHKRFSPIQIYEELKTKNLESGDSLKEHISKFFKLWSRNQWKRERLAPSFHLDDFNVDPKTWYRFPILSGGYEEELAQLENF